MSKFGTDASKLLYFGIFACAMLVFITLILDLYVKKNSFDVKKSKVYGLLTGLDNSDILSLSIIAINYMLLVFLAITTSSANIPFMTAIAVMSILPWIITKNFIKIPFSLIVNAISVFALYILSYVHTYLTSEGQDTLMRISVFFIIAFVFIYFTYNFINDVNDIASLDSKEKGKGGKKYGIKKSS